VKGLIYTYGTKATCWAFSVELSHNVDTRMVIKLATYVLSPSKNVNFEDIQGARSVYTHLKRPDSPLHGTGLASLLNWLLDYVISGDLHIVLGGVTLTYCNLGL
jgi:hypothetical protein